MVKLEKDEKATNERGTLDIRRLGVNEMLRRLRLKDENSKGNTPDGLKDELETTATDVAEGEEEEGAAAHQHQG